MALTLYAEVGVVCADQPPDGAQPADQHHPASVAFARAGGQGSVWVRSPIPSGRGLGFSGAVRLGGILAAHAQQSGAHAIDGATYASALTLAAELEGHADNVAASLLGGVVATAGTRAVQVRLAIDPAVVLWVPSFTTSTDASRGRFGESVPFTDAVFNVGRTALLVAALVAGDVASLRAATEDRLHQSARFTSAEPSRDAMIAALGAGAWCAWLSGSGPSIAALCAPDDAERLAAQLPDDGHTKIVRIDHEGAVLRPLASG